MADRDVTITEASLVSRRAGILETEVGGEIVLMSVERGSYYGLDPVGSDIWRQLGQPVRVAQLCQQLLQRYDDDPATVLGDVIDLLSRLSTEGLIDAA